MLRIEIAWNGRDHFHYFWFLCILSIMPLLFLETSVFRCIFQICRSSLGLWVFLFSGTACGVLVPQPGTEPRYSAVNVQKERPCKWLSHGSLRPHGL